MFHFLPEATEKKHPPNSGTFVGAIYIGLNFFLASDTELQSSKSNSENCLRESCSEIVTPITNLRSPRPPHFKPSVSTKHSFLFLLSTLLTTMFPTHNQKLAHLYSSLQQRELQVNFHSCFLPIFELLTLLILALCQHLLYVNIIDNFF